MLYFKYYTKTKKKKLINKLKKYPKMGIVFKA